MATHEEPQGLPREDPSALYYVVQNGDTLSSIAEGFYGHAVLHTCIFEANLDVLVDPNRIDPGQRLRIP